MAIKQKSWKYVFQRFLLLFFYFSQRSRWHLKQMKEESQDKPLTASMVPTLEPASVSFPQGCSPTSPARPGGQGTRLTWCPALIPTLVLRVLWHPWEQTARLRIGSLDTLINILLTPQITSPKPSDTWDRSLVMLSTFFMYLLYICICFFLKNVYSCPLPILCFVFLIYVFAIELCEFLLYFEYKPLIRYLVLKYFGC